MLAYVVLWQRRRRENMVPHYLYDEAESFLDEGNKLLPAAAHQQQQQSQYQHPPASNHRSHQHHHQLRSSASINGDVVSIDV